MMGGELRNLALLKAWSKRRRTIAGGGRPNR